MDSSYAETRRFNPRRTPPIYELSETQRRAILSVAMLGDRATLTAATRRCLIADHIVVPTGRAHRAVELTSKGWWVHAAIIDAEKQGAAA
jgi:hypothetical protein